MSKKVCQWSVDIYFHMCDIPCMKKRIAAKPLRAGIFLTPSDRALILALKAGFYKRFGDLSLSQLVRMGLNALAERELER